jgi:hypothetical protein
MHFELLSYSATQPNTGAAAAAFNGDSHTIKNDRSNKGPELLAIWAFNQVEGFHQIAFPTGHDTTRGWRTVVEANDITDRLDLGLSMPITAQELMTITIAGSNVAGDVETGHVLVHYRDLPGIDQRNLKWDQVRSRREKLTTVQATITGSGAGYSGSELITADSDLLLANRDYAILGIETITPVGAVWIQGPDTGNVKIGVPGNAIRPDLAGAYFAILSRAYDLPLIPVINSGNRQSTTIGVAMNENAGATIVSLNLALLSK